MTTKLAVLTLGVFVLGTTLVRGDERVVDELSQDDFRRLHHELQRPDAEPWRSIPWRTSLLDAQAQAAHTAKPLFIWAMDGHPLGCT